MAAANNPRQIASRTCGCPRCLSAHPGDRKPAKRCTGAWQARYRDAAGRQRAKNFPTKAKAEAFLEQVHTELRSGTFIDPARAKMRLGVFRKAWTTARTVRATTLETDESLWRNHIYPRWGAVALIGITHLEIQQWVSELPLAPASVELCFKQLSALLAAAVRDRRIPFNPAEGVRLPVATKKARQDREPPSDEQYHAILAALPHPIYRALTEFTDETGLRWGEVIGLRRRWLDLEEDVATVREIIVQPNKGPLYRQPVPKSEAGYRDVPLTPRAREIIMEHLSYHPADFTESEIAEGMRPRELVFRGPLGGVLTRQTFRRRVWQPACEAAGVWREIPSPDRRAKKEYWPHFHHLRHRYATRLENGNVPESLRKELLGHERPANDVTWRYSHVREELRSQVVTALQGRPSLRVVQSA